MIAHDFAQWLQFWKDDLPADAVEQLNAYLAQLYLLNEELVRLKAENEELRYSGKYSGNH